MYGHMHRGCTSAQDHPFHTGLRPTQDSGGIDVSVPRTPRAQASQVIGTMPNEMNRCFESSRPEPR